MNRQEIRGRNRSHRGRVNEAKGVLTGNARLERLGVQQRAEGTLEAYVGEIRRRVGEVIERLGVSIKA